jgi:hypothetical protein
MSRKLTAIVVASTLALGSISTSAWSAPGQTQQVAVSGTEAARSEARNVPPLAPAGAAGIREAQGGGNEVWIIGGFIALYVLLVLIGQDDDDDDTVPSTGTN